MRILDNERETINELLPGLDDKLSSYNLMELEASNSKGIELFKHHGGAGLLIPKDYGGKEASAVDAVRVTAAIASRSPSLAIATTMHQFSVASMIELAKTSEGFEWMLLDGIATDKRLMSSAFAEGMVSQSILQPTMKAHFNGKNWVISGIKKPCSLSKSMDLMTASVAMEHPEKGTVSGVALIPANSNGISIESFWQSNILAGAESDAVVLENVEIPPELLFELNSELEGELETLQTLGFIWFELLLTASYLGMAAALVEKVFDRNRGQINEQVDLGIEIKSSQSLLEAIANELDKGLGTNDNLAKTLVMRYSISKSIQRTTTKCVELLGGMDFIKSNETSYLLSAAQAISFHPPSKASSDSGIHSWMLGNPFKIM
ncbi:hypothetical protein [Alteromonas portus]|uniref:hypothetical protein n=1 Tax=Alteromonas portus TaxID=2565549 RepID=UPI003BF8976C